VLSEDDYNPSSMMVPTEGIEVNKQAPINNEELPFVIPVVFAGAGPVRGAELPAVHCAGAGGGNAGAHELHALHAKTAFSDCTLWDVWLPHATLWTGQTAAYRASFLKRRIDADGYVSMQQHRGMAHSEGWPFPAWQQSGGAGFFFSTHDEAYGLQYFALKALTNTDGWDISGAEVMGIDPVTGLKLKATGDVLTLTTPAFRCGTIVAPFLRLEWSAKRLPAESQPNVQWMFEGETEWKPERSVAFASLRDADGVQYANVPLYRHASYGGVLTRYRLTFPRAAGAVVHLKSLITAIDTRHPITNPHFVRGSTEYFMWTRDVEFLRANIERMRKAMRFALTEFSVREQKHVKVPWVGHDGRSGLVVGADGKKSQRLGLGVGGNYWDLLSFGGSDAPATIYLFDTLRHFAELERAIAQHPEWNIAAADADDLAKLADEVRTDFRKRFWSAATGRFVGWIDVTGQAHDFGFTMVNTDAIHYGLAAPEQAQSILAWLDGKREVADDTSRGADIYHWRFGARSTTRRNTDTYVWAWPNAESIPFGGQVQDGGAVLGFSYFDIMARLKTNGPDDAWKRLREILTWFREVQSEGGYRAYYAKPGRGTLQGGGPAGGLGIDQEFYESVLVPQVMLYGFLGVTPEPTCFAIAPRLPKGWPSLTVARVRLHDHEVEITAEASGRVTLKTLVSGTNVLLRKGTAALRSNRSAGTLIELP
jgi:hypothetical protein